MQLAPLVAAIREKPWDFIEPVDACHLGAFFNGYKTVNMALHEPLERLTKCFVGASGAGAFTRAYLCFEPAEAVDRLMEELGTLVAGLPANAFEEGPLAHEPPVGLLMSCARNGGRIGMALGEPTIPWLFNHIQGVLAAQRELNESLADAHETQLLSFERWLQKHYDERGARWHRIIRAYHGPCAEGIFKFVELWAEWQRVWTVK